MVDTVSNLLAQGEEGDENLGYRLEEDIVELQKATADASSALDDALESLNAPRDDMTSSEARVEATEVHERIVTAEKELLQVRATASVTRDRLFDIKEGIANNQALDSYVPPLETDVLDIDLMDIDVDDADISEDESGDADDDLDML